MDKIYIDLYVGEHITVWLSCDPAGNHCTLFMDYNKTGEYVSFRDGKAYFYGRIEK